MSVTLERLTAYPTWARLDLYAGDALELLISTEGLDLGSLEIVAEVRRDRSDPDALESFAVSIEGEGNLLRLTLDGDQTAALGNFVGVWDCQAGTQTLVQGSIFCVADVTKLGGGIPPGPFEPGYPITETAFSVDGPLADPWLPSGLPAYAGNPPVAGGGVILLEETSEGQTEAVGRPDFVLTQLVGLRASNGWDANPWTSGVRLFLIGPTGEEWYELYFVWTGTEYSAAAWRVTDDGATYDELIPGHVPDLPLGFPLGAAVAFQLDPESLVLRYLVSVDGTTVGLAELGASTGSANLTGPFTPALVIIGDAEATGFFSGGPPED